MKDTHETQEGEGNTRYERTHVSGPIEESTLRAGVGLELKIGSLSVPFLVPQAQFRIDAGEIVEISYLNKLDPGKEMWMPVIDPNQNRILVDELRIIEYAGNSSQTLFHYVAKRDLEFREK